MRHRYLDGNDYFDSPKDEHSCGKEIKAEVYCGYADQYIFPCYVYDKHGKLLRIEYPKIKDGKKWTSRY